MKDKEKIKNIILGLNVLQSMGFEVVKSNSEQIALNNKDNNQPFVMLNDIGYLTPLPYAWFDIKNEIERLKELQNER